MMITKNLTSLFIMACLPLISMAQQAKIVRPILDLTPPIPEIVDNIKIDEEVARTGVTFKVDENLPALDLKPKTQMDGKALATAIARNKKRLKPGEGLVASSFMNDRIASVGDDVLFSTIVQCFAEHRPLVLSPDMVWLVIAQNFSYYVNEHAEELRDKLVSHEGRMPLVVLTGEDLFNGHPDWEGIMADFDKQIYENTKEDIAKTITSDFTTTGVTERIASQITLMDAMKEYFEYIVIYLICGIPEITLEGTPEDWQKVHDKAMKLSKYGMGWWTKELDPILKEFVKASKGKPNQKFWQDMVMKVAPGQLKGASRGCGGSRPTELDGWILKLFPYDKDGKRTSEKVPHDSHMLSEMVCVPFKYVVEGVTTEMELYAGLIGVKEDTLTRALTPQIGWMVRVAESQQTMANDMKKHFEDGMLSLRIKEVPEALREIHTVEHLCLHFEDRVILHDWMDEMEIKQLDAHGKVTMKEAEVLRKRFPQIVLDKAIDAPKYDNPNPPIIVLDGEEVTHVGYAALRAFNYKDSGIYWNVSKLIGIDVDKIAKVRVLEGTDATAKWGTRGVNGVIEVTSTPAYMPEMVLDSIVFGYRYHDNYVSSQTCVLEYDSLYRVIGSYTKGTSYATKFYYGADGKLQKHEVWEKGAPYKECRHEYDAQGRMTLECERFLEDNKDNRWWPTQCKEYLYDEQGRLVQKDVHTVRSDGQHCTHYRYIYQYGRGGKCKSMAKYEYVPADHYAYGSAIPAGLQMELLGKGKYDRHGRLSEYMDLLRKNVIWFEYDDHDRLISQWTSEGTKRDPEDWWSGKEWYYDRSGNIIGTKEERTSSLAYSAYPIEQVAGLRDGFLRYVFPSEITDAEFFTPTIKSAPIGYTLYQVDGEPDETRKYFYSEPE